MLGKDEVFGELHKQSSPLMLPNVWDAGSARLIEQLGAKAIATSSAGVAWALGYRDGDVLPLDEHLTVAKSIHRVIDVPLSVDLESGYSSDPSAVGSAVSRFIDAGAVGINLQDGTRSPALLAAKIEAARNAAEKAGVRLYINARTDVYARSLAPEGKALAETVRRARIYENAGADGLFVLSLSDPADIQAIATESRLLLNLIAWPNLPPPSELAALGVKRLSAGSWIPQALWTHTSNMVKSFLTEKDYGRLINEAAPYADVNTSFK